MKPLETTSVEKIEDEFVPCEEAILTAVITWEELAQLITFKGEEILGFTPTEEGLEYKISLKGIGH